MGVSFRMVALLKAGDKDLRCLIVQGALTYLTQYHGMTNLTFDDPRQSTRVLISRSGYLSVRNWLRYKFRRHLHFDSR